VMKSMPLSVTAAEPSRPPNLSFLSNTGAIWTMGVLNTTPDSFYAGSRTPQVESALHLASQMIEEGADVLDVGGESTRPGAEEIPDSVELGRVLPVIEAVHDRWPHIPLSIDSQKASVAREVLARGVNMVNDISALRADPAMAEVVANARCPVVFMHMQGTPRTMQQQPHYENVVEEVKQFFEERLAFAARQNIREDRVILDPGIGFGKTFEHNMALLKGLSAFLSFGRPILVGVSRKSFIGRWLGSVDAPLPPEERLEGSIAAALWAVKEGARGLRVHDVGATRRALRVWEGIQSR
jgi:dihydropteroate synthase